MLWSVSVYVRHADGEQPPGGGSCNASPCRFHVYGQSGREGAQCTLRHHLLAAPIGIGADDGELPGILLGPPVCRGGVLQVGRLSLSGGPALLRRCVLWQFDSSLLAIANHGEHNQTALSSAELPAAILETVKHEPAGATRLSYCRYVCTSYLPAVRRVSAILRCHAATIEVRT